MRQRQIAIHTLLVLCFYLVWQTVAHTHRAQRTDHNLYIAVAATHYFCVNVLNGFTKDTERPKVLPLKDAFTV